MGYRDGTPGRKGRNRISGAVFAGVFAGAAGYLGAESFGKARKVRIRFDKLGERAAVFDRPMRLIEAWEAGQVDAALAAMDAARAEGLWLAGYASYELGYALEPALAGRMPESRVLPLLRFGVYEGPGEAAALAEGPVTIGRLQPRWDVARYGEAFRVLHGHIGAGDIYQANLTFPIDVEVEGESEAIYAALVARQAVGHGALVLQEDLPDLLSRSPELFFRVSGEGRIETLPMKGTLPRDPDPTRDALNRAHLAGDEKNRAENLMIVDLLRNDLSRVAVPGSVKVPELFKVQSFATVHQMVSRVVGQMVPGAGLGDVFRAIYPCGSITGAPKVRAMEIIDDLEETPREAYCGTIGWAAPDGRAEFNVAIRTLMRDGPRAVLNVGGGVVWDSTAASEYEEALWKARYAQL